MQTDIVHVPVGEYTGIVGIIIGVGDIIPDMCTTGAGEFIPVIGVKPNAAVCDP